MVFLNRMVTNTYRLFQETSERSSNEEPSAVMQNNQLTESGLGKDEFLLLSVYALLFAIYNSPINV